MVVLRELGAIGLVEVLVDICLSSIVILQLVVREHGQTVERWVAWLELDTSLSSTEGILEVTSEVTAAYELVECALVELSDVRLGVVLVSLLLIASQHIDMCSESVDILIGALCLHVLQLLSSLRGADLTIYHSPLFITLGVLGVEVDGLVVETCGLTTIGTVRSLDITEQQVCRSILILGLTSLIGVASELSCTSGILLLVVSTSNLHQILSTLLVLLVSCGC